MFPLHCYYVLICIHESSIWPSSIYVSRYLGTPFYLNSPALLSPNPHQLYVGYLCFRYRFRELRLVSSG
jgi:hypothetical protein